MITVGIVIPCFNEEKSLTELLQKIELCYTPQVSYILVDNGSTDKTSEILSQSNIPKNVCILRVQANEGYGHGIVKGLSQLDTDYVGWTHADLQTDPGDVLKFLDSINLGIDFLKGKRFGRPLADRFFTFGMSTFVSLVFMRVLSDINAQPTIVKREIFESWKNPPKDFSLDLFAYVDAVKKNYRISRQKVFFDSRKWGKSHWNYSLVSRIRFVKRTLKMALSLKRTQ